MPASITMALVASRPKVSGSRMEMPASGPIPGSMPTSVPTTQPRNANHSTSGRSATENPSMRLLTTDSTGSEPQYAAFERRLEGLAEQPVGEQRQADGVGGGDQRVAALDHVQEREHQQRHGDEEAEPLIRIDAGGGDQHHQERVPAVAPVDLGEPLAAVAGDDDRERERD